MAAVGVAALVALDEQGKISRARLAMNAVAPTPMRSVAAEQLLVNEQPSPELFTRAAEACAADAKPITDVRATAEYRREMVRVLARRALEQSMSRANGGSR
jgi:carbon-monoxide dehydrogenase medium subunit